MVSISTPMAKLLFSQCTSTNQVVLLIQLLIGRGRKEQSLTQAAPNKKKKRYLMKVKTTKVVARHKENIRSSRTNAI